MLTDRTERRCAALLACCVINAAGCGNTNERADASPSTAGSANTGTPLAQTSTPPGANAAAPTGVVSADPDAAVILFVDAPAGPVRGGPNDLGVPITLYGKGFGASRGDARVTINGVEVASYLQWGRDLAANSALEVIVVQPGSGIGAGAIAVERGGKISNTDYSFSPTAGNIFYVAPSGSDGANCTEAAPCATILHAATDLMRAGDALLVRGGDLNDDEVWIRHDMGHSGSAAAPKIIRNYPGELPRFAHTTRPFIVDADHIIVSGFDFPNGKSIGVGAIGRRGNRVYNSRFSGALGYDAIGTHGDDIELAGNVCRADSSSVGTQGHCYYISHGSNLKLRYNIAHGVPGYGIHVFDQLRQTGDIQRVIGNVLIEGNLLSGSTERSGLIIAMGDEAGLGNHIDGVTVRNNIFTGNNFAGVAIGGNVRNVRIEHNTFHDNGRQGVTIYDDPTIGAVTLRNNLISQSDNAVCQSNCSWYALRHIDRGARAAQVIAQGNYFAPGPAALQGIDDASASAGDAGFVDAPALDFHLRAESPAQNRAAAAISDAQRDFDGRPRPADGARDPGAFERP